MNKKGKYKIIIILLFLILFMAFMITTVKAFLATYTMSSGEKEVKFDIKIEKIETITQKNGETLKVIIRNGGTTEAYLRVKIFSLLPEELIGNEWEKNADGYYYSKKPIKPGETMENLSFKINPNSSNIITIIESTQVLYGKYNETYADWNRKMIVGGE